MNAESENIPTSLRDGRYTLGKVIGRGGMAVVVLGHDNELDVERAVKILTPHGVSRDSLRRRLRAEAKAMAKLNHPNILTIYDVGAEGRFDYVVMDYAVGGSLHDRTQSSPLSIAASIQYLIQVLSALSVAHSADIVHRDVKPHNILLDASGRALLADFGIALLFGEDRRTRTGIAMGSVAFMPPEQRLDASRVGPSADIYAAGSTLYNLVTGENPVDLFLADTNSPRWDRVPTTLTPVLQRACRMAPEERWPSAAAMAQALIHVLTDLDTSHREDAPQIAAPAILDHSPTADGGEPSDHTHHAITLLQHTHEPAAPPPAPRAVTTVAQTTAPTEHTKRPSAPYLIAGAIAVLIGIGLLGWSTLTPPPERASIGIFTTEPAEQAVPPAPKKQPAPAPIVAPIPTAHPSAPAPRTKAASPPPRAPRGIPTGITGPWTGTMGGILIDLTLTGSNKSLRGTVRSSFGGNVEESKVNGSYNEDSRTMKLQDTDTRATSSGRYELHLNNSSTKLEGTFIRNAGGLRRMVLSRSK